MGGYKYNSLMSEKCLKCFRPIQTCYCKYIHPVETRVKFVFLMHPREAYKQKTGTGRLASLSLKDSEIIVDKSFDQNKRVKQLIEDSSYYPMVLYPGDNACFTETFNFEQNCGDRELLVFLLDATWIMARKMMYRSRCLQELPRLSFSRAYRSEFAIKTQPADYCLSTIESAYYLIQELRTSGVCPEETDPSGLLDVFRRMVSFQQECRRNRIGI